MPAIPVHHTDVSSGEWDGPANEARLKTDQDYAYYRRAYAWRDPDGDESLKSTYKFIHHEVDADGNPGAANTRACSTGIAILNGARGGTTIPKEDYDGVWSHLAAHLEDADMEPPELKRSSAPRMERRSYDVRELEAVQDGELPEIRGYAAVFGSMSEDLGGFREIIRPGAFSESIKSDDIRALWNHNPDYVLGRTTTGTLKLAEDAKGLAVAIDPPDTQWARDLITVIERGDVSQMSFAFEVIEEKWSDNKDGTLRELVKVKLYDVSPVTFPAYTETQVNVRSANEVYEDHLAEVQADRGLTRAQARLSTIKRRIEIAEKE